MRRLDTLAADSATLQAYLQEIAKFPRLTCEQEQDLGRRIRGGADDHAARSLVAGNLRFVVSYVRRYRHLGVPFLVLIHQGNLGLIDAAKRFDPERQATFIGAAIWWVRQSIMHLLANAHGGDAVSPASAHAPGPYGRQVDALQAQVTCEPAEGLGDDGDLSDTEADALLRLQGDGGAASERHTAPPDDECELEEVVPEVTLRDIDDDVTRDAVIAHLADALADLDPRARQIVRWRYGLHHDDPLTLPQIGERLGLPSERIGQIEAGALEKLRRSRSVQSYLN